jgi:hypothetical protein
MLNHVLRLMRPSVPPAVDSSTVVLTRWAFASSLGLLVGLGMACGNEGEDQSTATQPFQGANAARSSGASSGVTGEQETPANVSADNVAAADAIEQAAQALGRIVEQVEPICGQALDECGATPGCPEILACAAATGCSGRDCRCADQACEVDGPCRGVIDSAPGADAGGGSGPAAEAAARVGVCVSELSASTDAG